jgi:hypothetical protein
LKATVAAASDSSVAILQKGLKHQSNLADLRKSDSAAHPLDNEKTDHAIIHTTRQKPAPVAGSFKGPKRNLKRYWSDSTG